ncbi:hypothetical protein PCASD_10462 [Puccinia coronata f. sp. avenae]|uniref:Uncharacterized protein n=1 Tax=Puccinia coronata f. sp. avenae TaxID=200324 RepID=A0A2N5TFF0_9BASI|nr:hypothetical protein PCASD_10462 [Puccinia coronata f. sp. avenae]
MTPHSSFWQSPERQGAACQGRHALPNGKVPLGRGTSNPVFFICKESNSEAIASLQAVSAS